MSLHCNEQTFFKKNYFDKKRTELLAAIYNQKYKDFERIYKEIAEKIKNNAEFSEVDQKAINQIQHAYRKFCKELIETCSNDIQKVYKNIKTRMARNVRKQIKEVQYVEYDTWHNNLGFTRDQFRIMLKTVTSFQISTGCSNYCRRCNEWALPGVRKHFTFNAVKRLTKELFEAGNREFVHYSASDPLDWRSGDNSFVDIIEFMAQNGFKSKFGILTKIPKGSEKIIRKLLDLDGDFAVSVTEKNRKKIEKIERKVGKKFVIQHDIDRLAIAAGLDEDFASIKSSITDNYGTEITPEGVFLIVPTFTSALNPTGQSRIQVTAETKFFLIKKVGRQALPVEYFKPLQAIDFKGNEFTLKNLLNAQIENILINSNSDSADPPGMMNLSEYFTIFESEAIQCRRKLFPSVIKSLREKILFQNKSENDSRENRYSFFRRNVFDYFEFFQTSNVAQYKKNAFSFYLKAVAEYLKKHPAEKQVILHLRKKDKKKYAAIERCILEVSDNKIDSIIKESKIKTFDLFEILMFKLLDNPYNKTISDFIDNNPVLYDPVTDNFVSAK